MAPNNIRKLSLKEWNESSRVSSGSKDTFTKIQVQNISILNRAIVTFVVQTSLFEFLCSENLNTEQIPFREKLPPHLQRVVLIEQPCFLCPFHYSLFLTVRTTSECTNHDQNVPPQNLRIIAKQVIDTRHHNRQSHTALVSNLFPGMRAYFTVFPVSLLIISSRKNPGTVPDSTCFLDVRIPRNASLGIVKNKWQICPVSKPAS